MSHFLSGCLKERRREMAGIYLLNYPSLTSWGGNQPLADAIKDSKCMRVSESVERCVVEEWDRGHEVLLVDIWCQSLLDTIRKKFRHNVFTVRIPWSDDYVCDGNLGKGETIKL